MVFIAFLGITAMCVTRFLLEKPLVVQFHSSCEEADALSFPDTQKFEQIEKIEALPPRAAEPWAALRAGIWRLNFSIKCR